MFSYDQLMDKAVLEKLCEATWLIHSTAKYKSF